MICRIGRGSVVAPHMPEPPIRHSYRVNETITHMSTRWHLQVRTYSTPADVSEAFGGTQVSACISEIWERDTDIGSGCKNVATLLGGSSRKVKVAGGSLPTAQFMH